MLPDPEQRKHVAFADQRRLAQTEILHQECAGAGCCHYTDGQQTESKPRLWRSAAASYTPQSFFPRISIAGEGRRIRWGRNCDFCQEKTMSPAGEVPYPA